MKYADFTCEANGCKEAIAPETLLDTSRRPTGYTRWCVPKKWFVRYIHVEASTAVPEHERLVVMCPSHSAGCVR